MHHHQHARLPIMNILIADRFKELLHFKAHTLVVYLLKSSLISLETNLLCILKESWGFTNQKYSPVILQSSCQYQEIQLSSTHLSSMLYCLSLTLVQILSTACKDLKTHTFPGVQAFILVYISTQMNWISLPDILQKVILVLQWAPLLPFIINQ